MVKTPVFKGSCTALVTPFKGGAVDYERLKADIDRQYENGTAAIVICGTTGENAVQSQQEHDELVRVAVNHTAGRMKVIAGIGSNNTEAALRNAQNAKSSGADAVLMVTPYYNKTTQKGLVEHFTYVADRVELSMILYNVPSRTGVGIAAETYKILSGHPNINGVKEASGDFSLIAATVSLCGGDLFLWSGNDSDTVPMMALGALGVISVASNLVPGAAAKLCSLCLQGDYPAARELFARYSPLFSALFIETNPIPIKTAMRLCGLGNGELRLPLTEMSEEHLAVLQARLRDLGLV